MQKIGIGLLGLGNVGAGVVKLLNDNAASISSRLGATFELRRIAVRDRSRSRLVFVDPQLISTDVEGLLEDPTIDLVVELIGGEEPARSHVLSAIAHKKHVVTANKALLAAFGPELFAAASQAGVEVHYEASVCGGVPVVRALREGLASDRIAELYGIVNGTSNYILTRMTEERLPFDEVLAQAQAAGYAEADPALDVDGHDAAHKLSVLAALSFGMRVCSDDVLIEGLRQLRPVDIDYAARFGYVIKPLAIARDHGDAVELRVHPTLIPRRFLLASVAGVFNAVYVYSQALGPSLYYGRGAGMMPTAVAVVSDLIEAGRDLLAAQAAGVPLCRPAPPALSRTIRSPGELESRYYLRFGVADRPGVLAQLTSVLGEAGISIRELVQEVPASPNPSNGRALVVMITHKARERDVRAALDRIDALPSVLEKTGLIRIFDGREAASSDENRR